MDEIYFDYAATTPVDARVLQAMLPYFTQHFGNPSSIHALGQSAEAAVEGARRDVAEVLHARSEEIIFTGCGTESDNLALRGLALSQRAQRGANHLLVSPVEHPAVLQTARQLRDQYGFELEYLPVDAYGQVEAAAVAACIRNDTALVSVIYANNEIGTINPVAAIGAVCREKGVPFHSDAVQAAAHLAIDVQADGVDALALGAHKFYGPKGVGVLFLRRDVALLPALTGGKQEEGRRAGTHNVPYIVGLAAALKLAAEEREQRSRKLIPLRDRLIAGVLSTVPRSRLTGHPEQRLPNHASFVLEGVDGNALLAMLDMAGYACSSGSACKVGAPQPSEVLLATGLSPAWALGSLRITLGKDSTGDQIGRFLGDLPELVARARQLS
ncbi:MAG: cysteine desulfurase [Chloroflexi bacterium]|jgi:cysteine desulfurase|nr:cysteine desulfurase [Chloroflexota bacterium]